MQPISIGYFLSVTLCVILGGGYIYLWAKARNRRDYLYFSLAVLALAIYASIEYRLLFARTIEEYAGLLRVIHIPAFVLLLLLALFLSEHLGGGRRWLIWAFVGVRGLSLVLNFLSPVSLNFYRIYELKQFQVLGETVNAPIGELNPWTSVGHLSLIVFLLICINSTVYAVRNGKIRKGLITGGGTIVMIICVMVNTALVFWGVAELPLTTTAFFLGVFIAMLFELTRTAGDAVRLASTLELREEELSADSRRAQLVEEAGHAGVWVRDLRTDRIWASRAWCSLFGFADPNAIVFQQLLGRIHDDDREGFLRRVEAAIQRESEYHLEYRIVLPDGQMKWISSRGRVDRDEAGEPIVIFGASVDVTPQKLAEEAAHDLSGRLIQAQEDERTRVARELHDGLSQSLALLSIKLHTFASQAQPGQDLTAIVGSLSADLESLAADVHRISHELHPAKLEQLGLETALHSFCREIEKTHGLQVQFSSIAVPQELSRDSALCLYRVAQEALQNVARHSRASAAKVTLDMIARRISLVVEDDGVGFDTGADRARASIGLIGMSERVRSVRGVLDIHSAPGNGTQIIATVPIDQAQNGIRG